MSPHANAGLVRFALLDRLTATSLFLLSLAFASCGLENSREGEEPRSDDVDSSTQVVDAEFPGPAGGTRTDGEPDAPASGEDVRGLADGVLEVPPPACQGEFVDYGCGASIHLNCSEDEGLISSDPESGNPCPVCRQPEPTDDTSCAGEKAHYRTFLQDIISNSCANYCEHDAECFAWEIQNACGTYALSLCGAIDEEPIMFAEEFAAVHCAGCGEREQVGFAKGPDSMDIEGPFVDFEATSGDYESILLPRYRPVCVESQCILVSQ